MAKTCERPGGPLCKYIFRAFLYKWAEVKISNFENVHPAKNNKNEEFEISKLDIFTSDKSKFGSIKRFVFGP